MVIVDTSRIGDWVPMVEFEGLIPLRGVEASLESSKSADRGNFQIRLVVARVQKGTETDCDQFVFRRLLPPRFIPEGAIDLRLLIPREDVSTDAWPVHLVDMIDSAFNHLVAVGARLRISMTGRGVTAEVSLGKYRSTVRIPLEKAKLYFRELKRVKRR